MTARRSTGCMRGGVFHVIARDGGHRLRSRLMQVVCEREDFIARTGARLYQSPIGFDAPRGDHDLNPEWSGTPNGRSYKRAAVLVPVIMRHDRLTIMLTHRGSALRAHSGQISFPGGKVDPGDPSLRATALR